MCKTFSSLRETCKHLQLVHAIFHVQCFTWNLTVWCCDYGAQVCFTTWYSYWPRKTAWHTLATAPTRERSSSGCSGNATAQKSIKHFRTQPMDLHTCMRACWHIRTSTVATLWRGRLASSSSTWMRPWRWAAQTQQLSRSPAPCHTGLLKSWWASHNHPSRTTATHLATRLQI